MRKRYPFLLFFAMALLLSSCANYKLNYDLEHKDTWSQNLPSDTLQLEYKFFLIGDAGNSYLGNSTPAIQFLEKKLKEEGNDTSTVIFLGDNIYQRGMPSQNSSARELAEHRITMQLDIVKEHEGRIIFLPGNLDWVYGIDGVKRQEDFVDNYLERDYDVFVPEDGCSGPEEINFGEHLTVIVVDSEWYLHDWETEPKINANCAVKTRREFMLRFEEAMKKNRQKNVIVAMHHPLYTYGSHGGQYTFQKHIFPLQDIKQELWIPLPIIGSIGNFLRSTIGHRQDVSHPLYKEMRNNMLAAAKLNGNFVFVAGHEHSMQYIEREDQYFIVSGSGSKVSPVNMGIGSKFAYAKSGFAELNVYNDGSIWVQFWEADETGTSGKVVFRKKIKDALPILKEEQPTYELYYSGQDSITVALEEGDLVKSKLHRFLWGEHYRSLYHTKVDVPILDLEKYGGGVIPIERGGGYQTNSLRLEAENGHQYVLRALKKDASRTVPYPLNQTFITEIFRDNFTAANPFGAFVLPTLADSAGIFHTNPKLYYLPAQPRLSYYNDNFANQLYLLEERPDDDWSDLESFGNSKEIIGTEKVIEEMRKSQKHVVDQKAFLQARLFDLIIADWDRHFDQWRWASFKDKEKGLTIYKPIPRDRDQVFSDYDGIFPAILRQTIPFLRQLRPFQVDVGNIKWSIHNGRFVNSRFLNELSWSDWQAVVQQLQANMTDEAIEQAIRTFPPPVYNQVGEKTIAVIKGRRDRLMEFAREYYEFLAKEVNIVGTRKEEIFEVQRLNDDETLVRVFDSGKDDEPDELLYERLFYTKETKEVLLYGLDEEDVFKVTGDVNKGIKVRLIGGLGEDVFIDSSRVVGLSKKTKVYDNLKPNKLQLGSEAKDLRTKRPEYNTYDFRARQYDHDYNILLPLFGYNPDDGVFIGASYSLIRYGFGKLDYAQRHTFSGRFAFATGAYDFGYLGEFTDVAGKWDGIINAKVQAPQFVSNFFGLGNESKNDYDDDDYDTEDEEAADDLDFNRVRQRRYGIYPGLRQTFIGGFFQVNLLAEAVQIEKTAKRFIATDSAGVREAVFNHQYFGGIESTFVYDNVNNDWVPSRGIKFHATAGWKANLQDAERNYGYFSTSLSLYQNFARNDAIVFATRIGAEHRIGEFEFYQAAYLGGITNHRGFRNERFAGRTSFYQNIDLRIKLFSWVNYYFPVTMGMFGGYDYGRVWLDNEDSTLWHHSVGGGLWASPFDSAVLTAGYFHSRDGNRVAVSLGFLF